MAAKVEYRVANEQWEAAQELWPDARAAAVGHPLEWSLEVDL